MTDIFISARRGAGAPAEILYGTVTFKPTLAHSRSTSIVLPAPTTFDLVSGQVVATNVQPTPEPVAGQIEWAYEVTFKDRHSKTYSFIVGVPDSTTQVNFTSLPRYYETKPPLFGAGPKGEPGEAATITVGTVTSGTTPSVTNSGTNTDAVLDFVLAKGDKGDTGVGVATFTSKHADDLPSTYPDGLSYFTISSPTNTGWPFGWATISTLKKGTNRVVQEITSFNGTTARRVSDNTGDVWQPFQYVIMDDDLATTSANGLMSSADKSKLDGLKPTNVVTAEQVGAVGDGVTDDTVALNDGLALAGASGKSFALTANKTYRVSALLTVPQGVEVLGSGARIEVPVPFGNSIFSLKSNSSLKDLTIWQDTSVTNNTRGLSVYNVSNVTIDNVTVEASVAGAGAGNQYRTGLNVELSSNIRVSNFKVKNFDFSINLRTVTKSRLQGIEVDTYQRGIYILDCQNVTISDSIVAGTSPNAGPHPGHNGILIGTTGTLLCVDNLLDNVVVRDSGEHGIRIGSNYKIARIAFRDCTVVNVGRCGFKVLGGEIADNNYHEYISFTDCIVEDAGNVEINAAGFMLQFVKYITLTNPKVVSRNKTYSAGIGIEMQATDSVVIINPYISTTIVAGIKASPVLGDLTEIVVEGGYIFANSGDCIWIDYGSRTLRRLRIGGYPELNIGGAGYAVKITNSTGNIVGRSLLSFYSVASSTSLIHPDSNTSGIMLEAKANFPSTLDNNLFANGSVWWDTQTTGAEPRYKVGGAWRKAAYV